MNKGTNYEEKLENLKFNLNIQNNLETMKYRKKKIYILKKKMQDN